MMIEVDDLMFKYPDGRQLSFGSFKIDHGQHSLILGESGSGKTTLLHLLGGLLRGFSGGLKVNGTDVRSLSDTDLDHFRGQYIGFIFQKMHLVRSLNVEQNLLLSPWLSGGIPSRQRAEETLERLGLSDKLQSKVSQLSQGQAQRVAIARAVMNKPSVIIADEPTSALDDRNCNEVVELLLAVAKENNSTLVIATHDQRLKSRISNRIDVAAA
jgi:ABC-type lipoprotein export system ATPase subunit